MNKTKYYLIYMLLTLGLFSIISCSSNEEDEDPCENIICENDGICEDGTCICPTGFIGPNCTQVDVQALLNAGSTPKSLFDEGFTLEQLYGKTYEGGFIFYLNTTDGTGMVAATENQSDEAIWGCFEIAIDGADGKEVGTGAQNTTDILSGCNDTMIAARLCRNLGEDWFLPSIDELNLMYSNLHLNDHGGFASDWYWSSSERDAPSAFVLSFGIEYQGSFNKGLSMCYVRAARWF